MARLLNYSYCLPELVHDHSKSWRDSEHEKAFEKLCAERQVISFPFADSFAWYLVVKLKPLTLQHIDYSDGWHVPYPMIRGLRTGDVEAMLALRAKRRKA